MPILGSTALVSSLAQTGRKRAFTKVRWWRDRPLRATTSAPRIGPTCGTLS